MKAKKYGTTAPSRRIYTIRDFPIRFMNHQRKMEGKPVIKDEAIDQILELINSDDATGDCVTIGNIMFSTLFELKKEEEVTEEPVKQYTASKFIEHQHRMADPHQEEYHNTVKELNSLCHTEDISLQIMGHKMLMSYIENYKEEIK